ncbi:MAG: hypothetical protein ACREDR_10270, partial [Blastocatellia bacterium]
MNQLKQEHNYEKIGFDFASSGPNKGVGDLGNAFFKYATALEKSVNDAQGIPAQIDAYIKSNQSGNQLLESAQRFQGIEYKAGMQCSDLVIKASNKAGIIINNRPIGSNTMTQTWFQYGMGPEFRQILGGDSGETLAQWSADEGGGKISIPLGAVIVANGHAALFNGVVKVGGSWQIITFDANNSSGWT